MKNIYIACNTLRDEIEFVLGDLKADYPVLWVDSGLHNFPQKLNTTIQEQIAAVLDAENIVLLFGSCGNSVLGLLSPVARIIIPRVDDCISLVLGGNEKRRKLDKEASSYYLTKGYLQNETNIWTEYLYCIEKYGIERAKKVSKLMVSHFKKLVVIDSGSYKLEEITQETNKIAQELELIHEVTEGTLRILYKAFREEWDEDFVIVEPGHSVGYRDFGLG